MSGTPEDMVLQVGQHSAVISTMIESCQRCGMLIRIAETTSWQVAARTPEKWVDKH